MSLPILPIKNVYLSEFTTVFLLDKQLKLSDFQSSNINIALSNSDKINETEIRYLADSFANLFKENLDKIINTDTIFETSFKLSNNLQIQTYNARCFSYEDGLMVIMNSEANSTKQNSELDSLLYRITYDLRSPLTTIMGILSVIDISKIKDKESIAYLDMLKPKIETMDGILNSINSIVDVRYHKPTYAEVSLDEIINDLRNELHGWMEENNASSVFHGDKTVLVNTDNNLLKLILIIFTKHLIKFKNPLRPPHIYYEISNYQTGFATLSIRDSAIDLSLQEKDLSFKEFYQSTSKDTNYGLELFFANTAAEKIGCTLSIRQILRDGVMFNLHIPKALIN